MRGALRLINRLLQAPTKNGGITGPPSPEESEKMKADAEKKKMEMFFGKDPNSGRFGTPLDAQNGPAFPFRNPKGEGGDSRTVTTFGFGNFGVSNNLPSDVASPTGPQQPPTNATGPQFMRKRFDKKPKK